MYCFVPPSHWTLLAARRVVGDSDDEDEQEKPAGNQSGESKIVWEKD